MKTYSPETAHASPWTIRQRAGMLLWEFCWTLLCQWTPKPLNRWRLLWLRIFGAKIHGIPFVHQRARIQIPWRLTLRDRSCLGDRCHIYNLAEVEIGERAIIAQEAYLCTGTHDLTDPKLALQTAPIVIGPDAFVGARAFLLPGVCLGAGAVAGACAVVTRTVEAFTVVAGNPAAFLRARRLSGGAPLALLLALFWAWPLMGSTPPPARLEALATLVIYNADEPDSVALAHFYQSRRNIPPEQLVGLKCSAAEEITRREYDSTIAGPLREIFDAKGWWKLGAPTAGRVPVLANRIRYVAVMRGVPLKVAPTADYPGDRPYAENATGSHNEASVDSELAVLAEHSRAISGAFKNPYYLAQASIFEAKLPALMLVCRLDGPSPAVVRRMITDSLAAEKSGLEGLAYIDGRGLSGQGLGEGDRWLEAAALQLQNTGVPVIMDSGDATFPDGYPLRQAAIYLGWYAEQPCGPFAGQGVRFVPGAIACHIHSFSGSTVRDAHAHWVGPLLEQGAAAALGNVYEPYLSLTTHLDVFTDRLLAGSTFAEAAYMGQPVLSWMNVAVGDPLYRPFSADLPDRPPTEWRAYRSGARLFLKDRVAGEAKLRAAAEEWHSGAIWEGLGLLQIRAAAPQAAADSFARARRAYPDPADKMRTAIHEVNQDRQAGLIEAAVKVVSEQARSNPRSPALPILRSLVPEARVRDAAAP